MMKFVFLVVCVSVALALEPVNTFDDESAVKSLPTENVANSPTTDDIQTADTKHKKYGHHNRGPYYG
jgi:hypothetical protein